MNTERFKVGNQVSTQDAKRVGNSSKSDTKVSDGRGRHSNLSSGGQNRRHTYSRTHNQKIKRTHGADTAEKADQSEEPGLNSLQR